jgi:hypothetical protein
MLNPLTPLTNALAQQIGTSTTNLLLSNTLSASQALLDTISTFKSTTAVSPLRIKLPSTIAMQIALITHIRVLVSLEHVVPANSNIDGIRMLVLNILNIHSRLPRAEWGDIKVFVWHDLVLRELKSEVQLLIRVLEVEGVCGIDREGRVENLIGMVEERARECHKLGKRECGINQGSENAS